MNAVSTAPRRATRKMFVAFINVTKNGIVILDLDEVWRRDIYSVMLPVDHPAIAAFADDHGKLDALLDMQGGYANVQFENFTSDTDIDYATIVSIKKVKGKA